MADWVTVAAYLTAAVLTARAAGDAYRRREKRDWIFWHVTTLLLVFLGVNELLDLQTLLTSAGRAYAKASGWYGDHRRVQYLFILALSATAVLFGTAMVLVTRRAHPAMRLALSGLVFIGLFVLLRAASFHHLDELLGSGAPQFNWGSIQEMIGILIVAGAATLYTGTRRRRPKQLRKQES